MTEEFLSTLDQEALDEMVHEVFAGMAADKNNEGKHAQVAFLLKEGFSKSAIERQAGTKPKGQPTTLSFDGRGKK